MPKQNKTIEEHLKAIELLLVGLMNQKSRPKVKELSKLIGVSDKAISDLLQRRDSDAKRQAGRTTAKK
ncbi:MAG: hypothetical protein ACYC9U_05060 [Nitrososphaerales archaeon]